VFEGFQEFLAAALSGAAAVGADGHEHDRFAGEYSADAVLHQAAVHSVAAAAITGELLQLLLGHAGVVLELERLEGAAIRGDAAHPANEVSFSGACRNPALRLLPMLQHNERFEAGAVEIDLDQHGLSVSPH